MAEGSGFTGSKVDETTNTLRFRQQDPENFTRFRVIVPGAQASKALRSSESLQRMQGVVDAVLRERYQKKNEAGMLYAPVWIRDFYKDNVVFDHEGQTYRSDYEITRDNGGEMQCTLGDAIPVEVVYQDVKKVDDTDVAVPDDVVLHLLDLRTGAATSKFKSYRVLG